MFTAMVPAQTPISRDHNKKLVKIIQALLANEQSSIFRKPIAHKALAWEDYKEFVKKPTDLNFVRRQYNEGKYKFVEEVLDEIQLVFDNVFTYGKKEHQTYNLAIKMQKYFDDLLNDFLPEYYQKVNRVAYFKQFENNKPYKPQKKSNQERNSKKVQKMDVQPVKQEVKFEVEPEVNQSKRRQSLTSRKALNYSQQNLSMVNMAQQNNTQGKKKIAQSQTKSFVENKKGLNNNSVNNSKVPQPPAVQPPITEENVQPAKQTKQSQPQGPTKPQKLQPSGSISDKSKPIKSAQNNELIAPLATIQPVLLPTSHLTSIVQPPKLAQPSYPPQQISNQDSQQNHFPPILVNLNKSPSLQQVNQITNLMKLFFEIQEFETLSKVVKILTKHQKENMIIDGEDVSFRMNQIHVSTYGRIRKELEVKLYQIEQNEKVADLAQLKAKYDVRVFDDGEDEENQNNSDHPLGNPEFEQNHNQIQPNSQSIENQQESEQDNGHIIEEPQQSIHENDENQQIGNEL